MYCAVRFFVRLYNEDVARLSPCKDELCNMTEKMQARHAQNPINGLCAVLPYFFLHRPHLLSAEKIYLLSLRFLSSR
ncbi:MAG TPA: hypothetical protein DHW32_08975 [Ruminococcaceae bacterium]|nr:hypothetical protein [Oscillospiraceae bacterium]HCK50850.1 hypothetical protein [Oscillospiraceae bacterium]